MTSPFAVRGIVEGFYGNPWTHAQRLEMVDWLAGHGMNTFVYGPKDDPLLRADWREAYDGEALARLRELVDRCAARGIRFVYCVSPGLSIRYSSDADRADLGAKLDQVAALGVDAFGLLLDDIPAAPQHSEDIEAYGHLATAAEALATAHAELVAHVASHLGPDRWLIACPWAYWGRGDERYLKTLAAGIPRDVDLFWTGRAICSPTLDLDDARRFEATTGRKPLYWDNYPVNDVAMTWELHIGPYRGRDPRLAEGCRGIIANPMELCEASKVPLATIADYLLDPAGYWPTASWWAAIRATAGGDHDDWAFGTFADSVQGSCLSTDDAPEVTKVLEAFAFAWQRGDGDMAAEVLHDLAEDLLAAASHLLRGPVANRALIDDCRPWIEAFELGAQAIRRIADLAAQGRLETDAKAELIPYLARLRDARVRVFGDALDMTLADLTETHTRPGRKLQVPGGENA